MKKTVRRFPWIIIGFVIANASCSSSQVPPFNPERAFEYLKKQCAFGPRNPGSDGHRRCLTFLVEELEKYADTVVRQPFMFTDYRTQKSHTLTNVIASFGRQGERILLCAHWDTRPIADFDPDPKKRDMPIPGANDGASGVAILLEISRILKENPPVRGIDIILFDGEDSGQEGRSDTWCQGSRYFADNKGLNYRPRYGILIDMIGDRDLHIPVERYSQQYAPDLVDRVWTKAEDLGLYAFDRSLGPDVVDDHRELFRVGIPAIDLIDFDYPYWHTTQDTEDKCSAESLGMVGTLLLHLVYE
jgi:hypothetical protein